MQKQLGLSKSTKYYTGIKWLNRALEHPEIDFADFPEPWIKQMVSNPNRQGDPEELKAVNAIILLHYIVLTQVIKNNKRLVQVIDQIELCLRQAVKKHKNGPSKEALSSTQYRVFYCQVKQWQLMARFGRLWHQEKEIVEYKNLFAFSEMGYVLASQEGFGDLHPVQRHQAVVQSIKALPISSMEQMVQSISGPLHQWLYLWNSPQALGSKAWLSQLMDFKKQLSARLNNPNECIKDSQWRVLMALMLPEGPLCIKLSNPEQLLLQMYTSYEKRIKNTFNEFKKQKRDHQLIQNVLDQIQNQFMDLMHSSVVSGYEFKDIKKQYTIESIRHDLWCASQGHILNQGFANQVDITKISAIHEQLIKKMIAGQLHLPMMSHQINPLGLMNGQLRRLDWLTNHDVLGMLIESKGSVVLEQVISDLTKKPSLYGQQILIQILHHKINHLDCDELQRDSWVKKVNRYQKQLSQLAGEMLKTNELTDSRLIMQWLINVQVNGWLLHYNLHNKAPRWDWEAPLVKKRLQSASWQSWQTQWLALNEQLDHALKHKSLSEPIAHKPLLHSLMGGIGMPWDENNKNLVAMRNNLWHIMLDISAWDQCAKNDVLKQIIKPHQRQYWESVMPVSMKKITKLSSNYQGLRVAIVSENQAWDPMDLKALYQSAYLMKSNPTLANTLRPLHYQVYQLMREAKEQMAKTPAGLAFNEPQWESFEKLMHVDALQMDLGQMVLMLALQNPSKYMQVLNQTSVLIEKMQNKYPTIKWVQSLTNPEKINMYQWIKQNHGTYVMGLMDNINEQHVNALSAMKSQMQYQQLVKQSGQSQPSECNANKHKKLSL